MSKNSNKARGPWSTDRVRFGVALHVGQVLYGNIGGGNRLDFTCIGHAVNLAARIEKIAGKVGRTIVASADFAQYQQAEWETVGEFSMAGFASKHHVLGLRDETPYLVNARLELGLFDLLSAVMKPSLTPELSCTIARRPTFSTSNGPRKILPPACDHFFHSLVDVINGNIGKPRLRHAFKVRPFHLKHAGNGRIAQFGDPIRAIRTSALARKASPASSHRNSSRLRRPASSVRSSKSCRATTCRELPIVGTNVADRGDGGDITRARPRALRSTLRGQVDPPAR